MNTMPETLTKTQVENILEHVVIDSEEIDSPQVIYASNGLEIGITTHRTTKQDEPFALLYVIDGNERIKVSGNYQNKNTNGNRFTIRNLLKTWYAQIANRACKL